MSVKFEHSGAISEMDVHRLGELVEERCPLAAMVLASGCELQIKWQLAPDALRVSPPAYRVSDTG